MKNETSLRKDIKTAWIDGCKGLAGLISLLLIVLWYKK